MDHSRSQHGDPVRTRFADRTLRVLTWNICELRGDLDALEQAVRDLDPDVMLVQEAPRLVLPQLRLERFARAIDRQILVGGRFGRGLAILGTDEIARQVVRSGMHRVAQRITDRKAVYPRGVAAVRLSVPRGGEVVVSAIHFALQEPNRITHARHAVDLITRAGAPVIIGGDLNEPATGPARGLLAGVSHDPADQKHDLTFPAEKPRRRIDAIYVTDGIEVLDAHRVDRSQNVPAERFRTASDHLPTWLEARIPRS